VPLTGAQGPQHIMPKYMGLTENSLPENIQKIFKQLVPLDVKLRSNKTIYITKNRSRSNWFENQHKI